MITLTVPVNFYEVRLGRLEEATRRAPKKLDDAKGALSDKRGWITVGELKRLLDLLGLDYESVEKDIIAMGSPIGGVEIVNPRFPFDLATPSGARLVAAALGSGGGLWLDRHGLVRFYYRSEHPESVERIVEAARDVLGDLRPRVRRTRDEALVEFPFVVGDSLRRVGIPVEGEAAASPLDVVIRRVGGGIFDAWRRLEVGEGTTVTVRALTSGASTASRWEPGRCGAADTLR